MEPVTLGIVGGVALLSGAVALRFRRKNLLSDREKNALKQPLQPAVQAILVTRGPDPNEATINTLKLQQDAGTLDIANLLKGTNGTVFTKVSPDKAGTVMPDDVASQIEAGVVLTVDVGVAGIRVAAVPSGNMLFIANGKADLQAKTVLAHSADPRIPDSTQVLVIPTSAITGIAPAP